MIKLVTLYGNSLRLTLHPFPLPYHRNAFLAAKAIQAVGKYNSSATFEFAEMIWNNLDEFTNEQADNLTVANVVDKLGNFANLWVNAATFSDRMKDPTIEWETRVAWKFGCSKAVYGTPTFHVNGVYVSASPTWSVARWRKLIDSLHE
jgi:2-hydroxychromene-2-carboxylate isomerase